MRRPCQRKAIAVHTWYTAVRRYRDHLQTRCSDPTVVEPFFISYKGFTSDASLSPETEAYTTHLAQSIVQSDCLGITFDKDTTFHILDLCTGSGCITLLLHALVSPHFSKLKLLGIDASHKAVALALQNLQSNVRSGRLSQDADRYVNFIEGNLFAEKALPEGRWDILISNPPYISPSSFDKDTSLSVRRYEPRTALVPLEKFVGPQQLRNAAIDDKAIGDAFYPRLLNSSRQVKAKLVVMEVADMEQAQRVANLTLSHIPQAQCEIWRDWPDQDPFQQKTIQVQGNQMKVIGRGNGRAVVVKTNFDEINKS